METYYKTSQFIRIYVDEDETGSIAKTYKAYVSDSGSNGAHTMTYK
jgi:hypothetical protein